MRYERGASCGLTHIPIKSKCSIRLRSSQDAKRRRDGRVAEGARLESVFRGNSNVGSNPTLSARISWAHQRRITPNRQLRKELGIAAVTSSAFGWGSCLLIGFWRERCCLFRRQGTRSQENTPGSQAREGKRRSHQTRQSNPRARP